MLSLLKQLVYPRYHKSYAQCGEDLLIKYIFRLRGIKKPTYLDIGANHPLLLSNTAIFYKAGSRGINVEANPKLIAAFNRKRPHDINLNLGIGTENGDMIFYVMEDDTLSTFSKDEADAMILNGHQIVSTIKIKVVTVQAILTDHFHGSFPDFLTIDVEGLDFAILQSIDYSTSRPKVICVEAAEYSPIGAGKKRNELIDFLVEKGYYEYANTNLNAIMVDKDFWFI